MAPSCMRGGHSTFLVSSILDSKEASFVSTTFADLGIPFPLFEADIEQASEYLGIASCSLCSRSNVHCFDPYVRGSILIACPLCDNEIAIEADGKSDTQCYSCHTIIPFPDLPRGKRGHILACYECLRLGSIALAKDTEFGLVTWLDALSGQTGAVPEYALEYVARESSSEFERVLIYPKSLESGRIGDDADWYASRVPREHLFELLHTPAYSTVQGEHWLFCCHQPMIYVGDWQPKDFEKHAPDGNGRAYFDQVVAVADDMLWAGGTYDCQGIYVFRCSVCGKYRAHWDMA